MAMFWVLFAIDSLLSVIALFFFFLGLANGFVSGFYMLLWLTLVVGTVGVKLAGLMLKNAQQPVRAARLLALLAAPGVLFAAIAWFYEQLT